MAKLSFLLAVFAAAAVALASAGEALCVSQLSDGRRIEQIYDTESHHCLDNLLLPRSLNARCGDHGINTATHVCTGEGDWICASSTPNLCGTACYDSNLYVCHEGNLLQRHQ